MSGHNRTFSYRTLWLLLIGALVVGVLGLVISVRIFVTVGFVNTSDFEAIEVGMVMDDVIELMGEPQAVSSDSNEVGWTYYDRFSLVPDPLYEVSFKDGKVVATDVVRF